LLCQPVFCSAAHGLLLTANFHACIIDSMTPLMLPAPRREAMRRPWCSMRRPFDVVRMSRLARARGQLPSPIHHLHHAYPLPGHRILGQRTARQAKPNRSTEHFAQDAAETSNRPSAQYLRSRATSSSGPYRYASGDGNGGARRRLWRIRRNARFSLLSPRKRLCGFVRCVRSHAADGSAPVSGAFTTSSTT
jgi:hypothetical protein